MDRKNLKILYLQFRLSKKMRDQEKRLFKHFGNLSDENLNIIYLLEEKIPPNIDEYDAILLGGTGDFEVSDIQDKYPKIVKELKYLGEVATKEKIPVLTICLQFWAYLFGGKVDKLKKQELGSFDIYLTEEGKGDPLFYDFPDKFKAMLGHKDYVSEIPKEASLLAKSDMCPTQAFRINENQYFLQFHPELDRGSIIERIEFYRDRYAPDNPEEYDELISQIEETPLSVSILNRFISQIVLPCAKNKIKK